MRATKITVSVLALLLMTMSAARAQQFMDYDSPQDMQLSDQPLPGMEQGMPPQAQPVPMATQEQIDQLVAPIALYPDALVAQILMASTYPLELVEASRWRQDPNNAQLQGDALGAALEEQPWDPSVKSILAFPQILSMMDGNLQWTEALGNAFLGQQAAVMDSVQRLRQMAAVAGHLNSTPQQTVVQQQGIIVIQPAQPEVVYVPVYNPTVVYGPWPYASYPPYYFPPPRNDAYASSGLISFGIGIGVVDVLWGWDRWDWHRHQIHIDDRRYEVINRGRPPAVAGRWEHDPDHRHGVPYSNPAVRAQYQSRQESDRHNNFRGFDGQNNQAQRQNVNPNSRGNNNGHLSGLDNSAFDHTVRQNQPNNSQTQQPHDRQQFQNTKFEHENRQPAQPQPDAAARQDIQQTQQRQDQARQESQKVEQQQQQMRNQAQQPQRSAPAFESFHRGQDVRVESQRGSASRASQPAPQQQQQRQERHEQRQQPQNNGNQQQNNNNGNDHGGGDRGDHGDRGGHDDHSRNR